MDHAAKRRRGRLASLLAGLSAGVAIGGLALAQTVRVEEQIEVELHVSAAREDGEPAETQLRHVRLGGADAEAWRARLTTSDFDARERAFHDLVLHGLKDRALFRSVLEWASSETVSDELAWTARLALREMRHRVQPVRVAWVPRGGSARGPVTLDAHAEAPDAPRGERALVETSPADSLRRLDLGSSSPLEATQRASLYAPRVVSPRAVQRNVQFHFQTEGVTVVVTEHGPQGLRERRFAAADVSTLLDEHPELRAYVPGIGGLPLGPRSEDEARRGLAPGTRVLEVDARVLGVKVTPIPLRVAEARLLGPGVGLLIERREPGTLAEHFDLRRGDILVEVAGQPVCSPEEISRALAERESLSFQVKIVDRNGIERVHRWESASKPAPVGDAAGERAPVPPR